MVTPIVKRKILTKENFHFIKNHKSYAFVKFLPQNIFFHIFPIFGESAEQSGSGGIILGRGVREC
jgi:hypothetical protein